MEARAHNVYTGNQAVVLKTNIRFVRIDEEGNPIPIGEKGRIRISKMLESVNKEQEETIPPNDALRKAYDD
jgi:hypothetical protein